jgi:hypothetical protein
MRKRWIVIAGLLALGIVWGVGEIVAACEHPSPIEVVSSSLSGNKLNASLSNPTPSPTSAYLYGKVQAGGRTIHFYGIVTVAPQSIENYEIVFPGGSITLLELLGTCGDIPWGVSDTSDPVVVTPKKKDGQGP